MVKANKRRVAVMKPRYLRGLTDADKVMHTIRYHMQYQDLEYLAEEIGVSLSCLYLIANGTTKWPRPKTFFGLINTMQLEMILVKRGQNDYDT